MRFVVGLLLIGGFGFAQGPEVDLKAPAPLTIDHFQTEKPANKERLPIPETPPKAPRAPQTPPSGAPVQDISTTAEYPSKPLWPLVGERPARQGLVLSVAESPLAKASLSDLKLKVLWEAAKQYREAVERGDRDEIAKAGKVLDDALKVTSEPAKSR